MRALFSKIFIVSGTLMIFISLILYGYRVSPRKLSFTNYHNIDYIKRDNEMYPDRLSIPDLNIDLFVYPGFLRDGKWPSTSKGVTYLNTSPIPGDRGNAILYGHNWKNLLGNLSYAEPGQIVVVKYQDGSERKFKIKYVQVVDPDQNEILADTEDRRITLYTCYGFLDRKRLVVTAISKEELL